MSVDIKRKILLLVDIRVEDDLSNILCSALTNALEVLVPLQVVGHIEHSDTWVGHHLCALDPCPLKGVSKRLLAWSWNIVTTLIRIVVR